MKGEQAEEKSHDVMLRRGRRGGKKKGSEEGVSEVMGGKERKGEASVGEKGEGLRAASAIYILIQRTSN